MRLRSNLGVVAGFLTMFVLFGIDAVAQPQFLVYERPLLGMPIWLSVGATVGAGIFALFRDRILAGVVVGLAIQLIFILEMPVIYG
jgi:hypothetical protein